MQALRDHAQADDVGLPYLGRHNAGAFWCISPRLSALLPLRAPCLQGFYKCPYATGEGATYYPCAAGTAFDQEAGICNWRQAVQCGGSGRGSSTGSRGSGSGGEKCEYTVAKGDTLLHIAAQHGLSLNELVYLNPQVGPGALLPFRFYSLFNCAGAHD